MVTGEWLSHTQLAMVVIDGNESTSFYCHTCLSIIAIDDTSFVSDVTPGLPSLRYTTIQCRLWVTSLLDYHRYDTQRYSVVCEWRHSWITIVTIHNDTASFVSGVTPGLPSLRYTKIQRRLWLMSLLDYRRYDRKRYSVVCEWCHSWITIVTIHDDKKRRLWVTSLLDYHSYDKDTASFVSDVTLGSISKIRRKEKKEMMIRSNSVDKIWTQYRRGLARE